MHSMKKSGGSASVPRLFPGGIRTDPVPLPTLPSLPRFYQKHVSLVSTVTRTPGEMHFYAQKEMSVF